MPPRRKLLLAFLALALLVLGAWLALRYLTGAGEPVPDRLVLTPARFADLPGWREDAVEEALSTFLRSCARIDRAETRAADSLGTAAEWRDACAGAAKVSRGNRGAARAFF